MINCGVGARHRLLADYRFDPRTGRWRHHAGPAEPPLRLTDVRFGPAGPVIDPRRRLRAGEDVLDSYLLHARKLLMSRADIPDDADTRDHGAAGLPPEFEALRWFHLPSECLRAAAAPGHGTVT